MTFADIRKYFRRVGRFVAQYEKILLAILAIVILISGGFWYRQFTNQNADVPTVGGTYVEGMITDKKELGQITARLTKAGLLLFDSTGSLQSQLAEKWSANTDQTEFRFTLLDGINRDEIVSVLNGRTDIIGEATAKTDQNRDVVVTLATPNPSFPFLMTRPLFDYGPYKLGQSNDQTTVFTRNTRKQAVPAYLNKIVIHAYASTDDLTAALKGGRIDGAVADTDPKVKNEQHFQVNLNRYYAVVFNTNKTPFRDDKLRKQLTASQPAAATAFTLVASDQEPYKTEANNLITKWKASGANPTLSLQPLTDVTATIGPSRNFQALLVGLDYGLELDPYYLWHSSQIRATGNNIAGVNNSDIDTMIDKVRTSLNLTDRQTQLGQLHQTLTNQGVVEIVKQESLDYYLTDKIHFIAPALPASNADRFLAISQWSVR